MWKQLALAVLAVAVPVAHPATASAAELFRHTFETAGGNAGTHADIDLALSVMTGVESSDWATITAGPFAPADVGRTLTWVPGGDPESGRVFGRLTDGNRHVIAFEWQTAAGGGLESQFEPAIIWGNPADPRVDLHGFRIDSLHLRIDRLTLTPEDRGGPWTAFSGAFTFWAEGQPVPEPSAAMAVAVVLPAGLMRRRRPSRPRH